MPTISGKLLILTNSPDNVGSGYPGEDIKIEAHPEMFDFSYQRDMTENNGHNLPLDPVSIAIAKAMGLNWSEIVSICKEDEEGISLVFQKGKGDNLITLPKSHPINDKKKGDDEEFIRCGCQSISIMIDEEIYWQAHRIWKEDTEEYIDEGMISIPREYIPESKIASIEQGKHSFDDIITWGDESLRSAKITSIEKDPMNVTFNFKFEVSPSGYSRYS